MTCSLTVTGASGFIGQSLLRSLIDEGMAVTAVSRRPCAVPNGVNHLLVEQYAETPSTKDETLIHLAERSDISVIEQIGPAYIDEVRKRATSLLEKNHKRFLYVSSGSVYGTNERTPHDTRATVYQDTVYNRAKLSVEELVTSAGGLVARISNIYGPPVKVGTIFHDVLSQIPGTGPLKVRNTHPARDYLWIDDLINALKAMALGKKSGTFNIGSGKATTAGDIARTALELSGQSDRTITSSETRNKCKTDCLILDSGETKTAFGWQAKTSLAMGMKRLIGENHV